MERETLDQHPFAVFAQTRFQGGFQFSALGADAGSEEPQIGRSSTDALRCVHMRCADDKADVVFGVPWFGRVGQP